MEQSYIPYVGSFLWISLMLLVGTVLRAKVKLFQKFLFPASIIGGVLGFILMSLGWVGLPVAGEWQAIPTSTFTLVTGHLFAFGFVGIGLISGDASQKGNGKEIIKGAIWMALVFHVVIYLQSVLGTFTMLGWEAVTGQGLTSAVGFLAGHGFTQGPGQTLAIAAGWEKMGLTDCVSIGLAFSAVGFFVAALVGVPLANWGIRKGYTTHAATSMSPSFLAGVEEKGSKVSGMNHITSNANVDSLSYHLAIMGVVYMVAYGIGYVMRYFLLPKSLWGLGFGFMFLWGLLAAMLFRKILNISGKGHMVDENSLRRLAGVTVDFMIISVMMAVKVDTLHKYLVPFLLISVLLTVVTPAVIMFFARKLDKFSFERAMVMLGYCTGTGASGLLLLRLVDPEFKTTAAVETGLMNLFALVTLPFLFIIFLMPQYGIPYLIKLELGLGGAALVILLVMHKTGMLGSKSSGSSAS